MPMGRAHIEFIRYCVRSKSRRDMKAKPHYAADALRRLRIADDCDRIMQMLSRNWRAEPHEVATMLGWQPPLVLFEGSLTDAAQQWLDARHSDWRGSP